MSKEKRKKKNKQKIKTLSGEMSRSFCHDFDDRAPVWRKRRESLYPSCLMPVVQDAAGDVMLHGYFLAALWTPQ